MNRLSFLANLIPGVAMLTPYAGAQFAELQRVTEPQSWSPVDTTPADLDGDGDNDVLVCSKELGTVEWYENLGSGTFGVAQAVDTGIEDCAAVAAADLDGDGDLDIALAGGGTRRLAWYENLGSGAFGPAVVVSASGPALEDLEVADLNGDGRMDLAVASYLGNVVERFESTGAGTFGQAKRVGSKSAAFCLHAFDMDGDGDLDLGVGSLDDNAPRMTVFLNTGATGIWDRLPPIQAGPGGAVDLSSGDIDGDGDLDMLCARSGGFTWLRNDAGTFTSEVLLAPISFARGVQLADTDGDGDLDALLNGADVLSRENDGVGGFAPSVELSPTGIGAMSAADLDGNGVPDPIWISVSGYGRVSWAPDAAAVGYGPERSLTASLTERPVSIAVTDLDGDGAPDIVSASADDRKIAWYAGDGTGEFGVQHVLLVTSETPSRVVAADIDGDGDQDLLVAAEELILIENGGAGGSFSVSVLLGAASGINNVGAGDVNGDGTIDLVVVGGATFVQELSWVAGLGGLTFAAPVLLPGRVTSANELIVTDIDAQAGDDIIVTVDESGRDRVSLYRSLGGGSFAPAVPVLGVSPSQLLAHSISVIDTDGDGIDDMVGCGQSTRRAGGLGGGQFAAPSSLPFSGPPLKLAAGDFNLDGIVDFAGIGASSGGSTPFTLDVYTGRGAGQYEPRVSYIAHGALQLIPVDIDGDGDLDLVSASTVDDSVGVLENLAVSGVGIGTAYCTPAVLNSTGLPAEASVSGSIVASDNDATLRARHLPPQQFGFFVMSRTQAVVPGVGGSQGTLCLGGQIGRVIASLQSSGPLGRLDFPLDLTSIPVSPPAAAVAGDTWNAQAWFRDANPTNTSNFTSGVSVTWQ